MSRKQGTHAIEQQQIKIQHSPSIHWGEFKQQIFAVEPTGGEGAGWVAESGFGEGIVVTRFGSGFLVESEGVDVHSQSFADSRALATDGAVA